jgi:hypothetical protein
MRDSQKSSKIFSLSFYIYYKLNGENQSSFGSVFTELWAFEGEGLV